MKHIIIFLILTVGVFGQTWTPKKDRIMGKYSQMESGDTLINMNYLPQLEGIKALGEIDNPPSVSVDMVSASPVSSSQAYGSWEFEGTIGGEVFILYDTVNAGGYKIKYLEDEVDSVIFYRDNVRLLNLKSYDVKARYKITRSINGIWEFYVDDKYVGKVADNTYTSSHLITTETNITNLTMTPLRTRDLVEDNVKLTYDLLGSTNSYSQFITSTSAAVGEVDFGFETQSVTFINDGVTTDTLYVSTSNTFPATNTIVRFGGEGFTKRMKTNKLYFKVGNVPLAGKKIRIEGY